jgi:putative ABC transport system substrate-binding protein
MKRREFLSLAGGATAGWSFAARAQSSAGKMARIAVLMGSDERLPESRSRIKALREGLRQLGWIEGRNAEIEIRWAAGIDRIRDDAAEMIALAPDVIVANGTPFVEALHQATRSIPIVFVLSNDPVGLGHIASMAKPGGNITGFTFMELSLIGKWLEMIRQMAPGVTRSALLFDPDTTPYYALYLDAMDSGPPLPLHLQGARFRDGGEIEAWISSFAREQGGSLISPAGPFNVVNGRAIAQLAEKYRLPTISMYRQFALDGGLMAYGPEPDEIFRRAADYVDRILKGASPADLPAQAPTQFHFVINLKTAKSLGLDPPTMLLATADEVIE